ncbi:MAG: hypothetical protein HC819_07515 [Cyclobacteriaceae bacterium]|nr:hypothetical protein [Cyclobacteriaceae bacterium]
MAIKFSVSARKNPRDPNSDYKYYPQPQSSGESDFKSLARKIQRNTGQNYPDVVGVLAALEDILPEELQQGLIVRFGALGSFYTTFKTTPSDTPEAVSSKNIEELRIRFRPDADLLSRVNTESAFEKVEGLATGEEEDDGEEAPTL